MTDTSTSTGAPADLDLDRLVAAFVHALRKGGMPATVSQSMLFRAALDVVGLGRGIDVYWAGRSTLVLRQEHVPMYDAMFLAFFHHNTSGFSMRFDEVAELMDQLASDDGEDDGGDGAGDEETEILRFSRTERLHDKDFGDFDEAELREAERVMAELRVRPATRHSRRRRRANHGDAHDLRRTVRAAMRRGGEPIDLLTTETGERSRRLVLLLDISGSMESYAKVLIRFAHAAVVGRGDVEVFALGTRLTRITRQLATRDPEIAVAAAAGQVEDWSGGTRLGDSLDTFVRELGLRGMARGAIVVVLSDGWDRGEPTTMRAAMERLHRLAHKVIWVNPLKAGPGYEPTAQGMAAALPYCDEFLEGHCLRSVSELAAVIAAADD
ncbi:MAG: VWA domain-containing protein [Actinomycetota bacterium]